jgi:hypothetical protein
MDIILLTGEAGVGKDTYAKRLSQSYHKKGKKAVNLAIADPLKHIALRNGLWDGKKDKEGRTQLQTYGDHLRDGNPDILLQILCDLIQNYGELKYDAVIVSDVRMNNEVTYILTVFREWVTARYAKVAIVRLVREFEKQLTKEQQTHITEQGVDDKYITLYFDIDHNVTITPEEWRNRA